MTLTPFPRPTGGTAAVMRGLALLIPMLFPATVARADMLADAFVAAGHAVAPAGGRIRLEVVRDPTVTTAMAARFEDGVCRVFALETSDYLIGGLAQLDPAWRSPYLEALFAHEFGHCHEQYQASLNAAWREPPSPALVPVRMHKDADGALWLVSIRQEALWGEILADAYLGLYLSERYPALSKPLIDFHLARRGNAAVIDPEHDTSRFLTGLSFERRRGEDIHEAGRRLRRTGTAGVRIVSNSPGNP